MDAEAKLTSFIKRLREMKTMAAQTAREAAPLVERVARANAAAGRAPDGTPWPLTKDGRQALPDVGPSLSVSAKGSLVQLVLRGVYKFHQYSKGGRLPQRQAIPSGGAIPANIVGALREGARRTFLRIVGGG